MAYTVYITPSAINGIEEVLKYYDSKVSNLGIKFTNDVTCKVLLKISTLLLNTTKM
ncbi:MAG TPA: hypothetical protein VKA92_08400 [Segetibacter sp.]|nr:hypothetical protein [Segetibacter sp.]